MPARREAVTALTMNTLAFTVCFAVWMMNGVLVTFLVDNKIFSFDKVAMGWLLGIPVLTGSVIRLPVGLATDRWGGKIVFPIVMLSAAMGAALMSQANSFSGFAVASLLFGLAGTGFAVGIAYTSVWFPRSQQGTALGIFGVGNAGSAITSLAGPALLKYLTHDGTQLEGWRNMPLIYAAALVLMSVIFFLATTNRTPDHSGTKTIAEQLQPLSRIRVWRFGLYYFLVFGAFVALAYPLLPQCLFGIARDSRSSGFGFFAALGPDPGARRMAFRSFRRAHNHVLGAGYVRRRLPRAERAAHGVNVPWRGHHGSSSRKGDRRVFKGSCCRLKALSLAFEGR